MVYKGTPCQVSIYLDEVYLVTALVPSETACLANSPGNNSLTAVWISRDVMVDLLHHGLDLLFQKSHLLL